MIEKILGEMIVFPCRIQNKRTGNLIYSSNNQMFSQPEYAKNHDAFFRDILHEGWFLCPDGYGVYAKFIPDNQDFLLIVHGLKVNGYSTAQGKTQGLSVKINQAKVEQYVKAFLDVAGRINEINFETMVESVHEIRSVNAALYNAAYQLQGLLQNSGRNEAISRNITALSELISARISLIDTLASDTSELRLDQKEIFIYRKFDKIRKCFIALGNTQKLTIQILGESTSAIKGSDYTDIIPLLMIDNAVKYSPDNKTISVLVNEAKGFIECKVTSWGPKIESEEFDLIFGRGYRGKNAISSGKNGSGIGLYFLKLLVENSDGKISVEQCNNTDNIKDVIYYETSFIASFPIWKH